MQVPTQRAVWAQSLKFFVDVIQSTLETIVEEYGEKTDVMAVPTRAILVTMETFTFLFGIIIAEIFFSIIDVLSKALQKEPLVA
jgi:hypothetical protein